MRNTGRVRNRRGNRMFFDQEVNLKSYSYSTNVNKRSVVCFAASVARQLHKSHPVVMCFFPEQGMIR